MIILAHDGSIYSDWVAHYTLHMAAKEEDRKLLVLNVLDGKVSADLMDAKLSQLTENCHHRGIAARYELLPISSSVHRTLRQAIPHDPTALLVCGTRVKPNRRDFLIGTIAEKLMRMHLCPVLALRVVQPGLLGSPHDLLLPLAGHANGLDRFWPVFRRLAPALRQVHLFRTLPVHPLHLPHLTATRERTLRKIGSEHLEKVHEEMRTRLGDQIIMIDRRVTVTSDWPNEVLEQASRLKVQMILLGVSERSLAHRVFHGMALERVLRATPCDVGIYRGP
jgi:nucleotide-binding universal stress UspA family protein